MALPLLVVAAVAAAQSPVQQQVDQPPGRPFMSPMGEPVFGRTPGEEGLAAWFAQADRNRDGSLTVDEMTADAERFFQTLDTNHDGEIDPDEISRYEEVIAPKVHTRALAAAPTPATVGNQQGAGERGGGRGHGAGGAFAGNFSDRDDEAGAGRYGLLQIPEPVVSADADFNRGVSREEFKAAAAKRFQMLDGNRTGRLTLSELEGIRHAAASAAGRPPQKPGDPDDQAVLKGDEVDDQPPM
jgi:Ca2+-binding EF-hand superfamily protein